MREYYYKDSKVELHGFYQESRIVEPSIARGGHAGGIIGYVVAVVEFDDGTLGKITDINNLRSEEIERENDREN